LHDLVELHQVLGTNARRQAQLLKRALGTTAAQAREVEHVEFRHWARPARRSADAFDALPRSGHDSGKTLVNRALSGAPMLAGSWLFANPSARSSHVEPFLAAHR
jgi:hypothetical protein